MRQRCPWVVSHGDEVADAAMPIEPFQFQCPGNCQRMRLLTVKPRRLSRGWSKFWCAGCAKFYRLGG
eukprot:3215790-Alexandrium_andersonii.AAC.1